MTSSFKRILGLFPGILVIGLHPAMAKPLSTEECTKLVGEHAGLVKKDVEKLMDTDPATATEKLKPEQLIDIERYLFLEGEIRFRCPEVKVAIPELPKPEPQKAKVEEPPLVDDDGPGVPMPDRNPKRL